MCQIRCNTPPGECGRKKEDDGAEPSCVDCGESGHPAYWRGCTAYRKYIADKKKRINEERDKKLVAATNVSRVLQSSRDAQGTSYISLLRPKQIPTKTNFKFNFKQYFKRLLHL